MSGESSSLNGLSFGSAATATAPARLIALDLLMWSLAPLLFLSVYIGHYGMSSGAVVPHLKWVLLAWFAVAACRALTALAFGRSVTTQWVATLLVSITLFMGVIYYSTVLIGLESWGQVISWDLVGSYLHQLPYLADAMGVSLVLVVATLVGALALLIAAVRVYVARFDWTGPLLDVASRRMVLLIVVAGVSAFGLQVFVAGYTRTFDQDEPIAMTFFPESGGRMLQNIVIGRLGAQRLDAREDQARAGYSTAMTVQPPINLVFIVVDALRPDHLGVYGYPRETTPNLDRIARDGKMHIVKDVRASCGESACGSMSIISSKYVHEFSERPIILQEVLRRHGYAVHVIVSGDQTNFYGLRQAYGKVDSYYDGGMAGENYHLNDDRVVIDRAALLPQWNGKPVMLQFHLMSNHILGDRRGPSKFQPAASYATPATRQGHAVAEFANYYDGGVAASDEMIGNLLEILQRKAYLQRTLVVITADHGESLGEHGIYRHANGVYDTHLRIPLLLIAYGYESHDLVPRGSAGQVDIAPTILTELGMAVPSTWSGVPLQIQATRDLAYFQERMEEGLLDASDPRHLMKYWVAKNNGKEFAFDLTRDPQEQSNIIAVIPEQTREKWRSVLIKLRPTTRGLTDSG